MKYTKWIVLLLCSTFALSAIAPGCGKYEEGPAFSLLSKKSRLTGAWECEKRMDFSSGDEVDCPPTYQYESIRLIFEPDNTGKWSYKCDPFNIFSSCQDTAYVFDWQFSDDKDFLITEYKNGYAITYKILRLTNKELWVVDKNETYETHYNKASQRTE